MRIGSVDIHRPRRLRLRAVAVVALVVSVALPSDATFVRPGDTMLASVAQNGARPNGETEPDWPPAVSADGRYVAFTSSATNLVPGDTNLGTDVFRKDLWTQKVDLVSVAWDGKPALDLLNPQRAELSLEPVMTPNGRYVAFVSYASNLFAPDPKSPLARMGHGDTNLACDVFVRDMVKGRTERVSVRTGGGESGTVTEIDTLLGGVALDRGCPSHQPSISADGKVVAFQSAATDLVSGDRNGFVDAFVHERATKKTQRVSVARSGAESDDHSLAPMITGSGNEVVFKSTATNLVPGDTNGQRDIFVANRRTRVIERVSLSAAGAQLTSYSGQDHDRTRPNALRPRGSSISADGRYVLFFSLGNDVVPANPNRFLNAAPYYVRDRKNKTTELVTVTSAAEQASGTPPQGTGSIHYAHLSADGRYVLIYRNTTMVDEDEVPAGGAGLALLVYDRVTGALEVAQTTLTGNGMHEFGGRSISADGRFVAFVSRPAPSGPLGGGSIDQHFAYLRDRGPAQGVGGLTAKRSGTNVTLSGWARAGGNLVATAPGERSGDARGTAAAQQSGDLVGATIAYRPERNDLFLRWNLAQIPTLGVPLAGVVPGLWWTPSAGYSLPRFVYRLGVNRLTYEVRAEISPDPFAPPLTLVSSPLRGSFGLYQCSGDALAVVGSLGCVRVASLRGGYGTLGNVVAVALPLSIPDVWDIRPGTSFEQIGSFSLLKTGVEEEVVDDAVISPGKLTLPPATLRLTVTSPHTKGRRPVVLAPSLPMSGGNAGQFSARFTGWAAAKGVYVVTARTCLSTCTTHQFTVTV